MSFATTLDEFCESLGCTNKDLAARCGISDSAISRYRKGERTPDVDSDYIRRLAHGIASLYEEASLPQSPTTEEIQRALKNSIFEERQRGLNLCDRTNDLLALLGIRNAELASALGIDPSYISRIRSRQRIPADLDAFASRCARFVETKCNSSSQTNKVAKLIGKPDLSQDGLAESIEIWLVS